MADDVVIRIRGQDDASKVIQKIKGELNSLGKTGAGGAGTSLVSGFKNASQVIGLATGAIVAFGVAAKAALDFGAEGAGITRLENSFQSLTQVAGVSGDELLRALDKAAQGTVANTDLILSTNRAMMLGLGADSEKLSQLMEVAAFRGRAMGLTTTQAFNDIVTGIGRASPLILDNLGIVIDAEKTYEAYAESIGKAKSELTKAEKTQALMTRAIEEGQKQIDEAGGLADDTAASYERLNAEAKNWYHTTEKGVGEALEPAAKALTEMFEIEQEVQRLMAEGLNPYEARRQAIQNIEDGTAGLADTTREWTDAEQRAIDEAESFDRVLTRLPGALQDATDATEDNEEAVKRQSDAYKTLLSNMFKVQDANEKFIEDEEKRAERQKDLEEEKVRVAIESGDKQKDLKRDLAELDRDIANARAKEAKTDDAREAKAERLHDLNVRRAKLLERIADAQQEAAVTQVEIDEKLAKLEEDKTEAIEDQAKARKQLVYDMLEQKAAQDGLISSEEVRFLQETAVQMGLVDRASADMAIAAAEAADMMWQQFQKPGEAVGDIQAALDRVVQGSPYRAQIVIETVGGIPGGSSLAGGRFARTRAATTFRGVNEGGARGFADGVENFLVPPGFPNDSFMVGLTSGETVNVATPDGRGGGGDKTVNVYVETITDRNHIRYLAQEISEILT